MSEEVKTADVEMAETTPEAKPEVVEVELPIEDVEDLNAFTDDAEAGAKKLSINIENHSAYLVANMEKLKADKDTCDVILRVKKGNFYWASFWAHKSVLAANSPVFAEALAKFQTYGLPAVETVCRPNLVLPRKIHGAALAALVDWMYTGKLTVHRKALGHLPLVAYYLKVQPLIDQLEAIFGDFKESGVTVIDEEIEDIEVVGTENDDNEDEKKEEAKKAPEEEKKEGEEAETEEKMETDTTEEATKEEATEESTEKSNWVVNLFVKRKWAEQLPNVKPIPGFYIMLQSDSHRIKSSRGRKGQDPFDPPESVLDTNWLAAYNQFKQKQLTARKNFSPRGGFRGRGFRGRGGFGPPRGFQGPPRGQFNRGGRGRGRGGPPMRGGFHNQGYNQGYNQGFNQHRGGWNGAPAWAGPPRGRGGPRGGPGFRGRGGPPRGGRGGFRGRGGPRGAPRGRGRGRPY